MASKNIEIRVVTDNANRMRDIWNEELIMASIDEHWSLQGYTYVKRIYLRNSKATLDITAKRIRAALDLAFASNRSSHYIDLDKEDFKPMDKVKTGGRQCKVCTARPERGKELCEECSKLSDQERSIVGRINPVVVITVDTRWRWITGHVSLDAELD